MDGNGQPTILLVDDCAANRRLCEKLLRPEGFVIAHAENGAQALEAARSLLPHVIIMDVMMPVMDGLEATRALRRDRLTSRIPIIVVSARVGEADLTAGLAAGADEYVVKPIRAQEFRLRVRSMARLRQAQLDLEAANVSLHRRTETLAVFNQFCEQVLASDALETTCRRIVETTAEFMQSGRVSLLLPDPAGRYLHFGYAIGIEESVWRELTVPLESPVAGQVFATQQALVVGTGEPRPPAPGSYDSAGFASVPLVCIPLRGKGQAIGVLNVTERRNAGDYAADEVRTLVQFSQTAALALNSVLTRRKLDEARDSIIFSMAKLSEYRHPETGKHLERVRDLSTLLARRLAEDPRIPERINEEFISDLSRSAPLHDIGKVAIPDRILLKPGKLTKEEFRTIQDHSSIGAQTLRSVIANGHEADFIQMAMDIARHHHERYDGTGYPDGLAGEDIPLSARIVCLADTYDAIRMEREYKPARSHEEASREILKVSGKQFDPRVVQAFCELEGAFRGIYEQYAEETKGELALENEAAAALAGA